MQTIESNHNCIVASHENYVHAKRILPSGATGGPTQLEHYTLEEVQSTFGWDQDSVRIVEQEPTTVFVDPGQGDYHVIDGHACEGMGAYAEKP